MPVFTESELHILDKLQDAENEITTLRRRLANSEARVAELEEALKDVAPAIEQIVLYGRDAFDKGEAQFHLDMMSKSLGSGESKAFILRKRAEAVEQMGSDIGEMVFSPKKWTPAGALNMAADACEQYAHRLRHEAEKAGGES